MMTKESKLGSKKRVLMIAACPFPWPRGTPVRIQHLAEALVQEGNIVDVVTYHLGKSIGKLPFRVYRISNVHYYHRVSAGPSITKLLVLNPMLIHLLIKISKTRRYDIIHAHHIEGLMIALTARILGLKLPIVYDAHTLIGTELINYGLQIGSHFKRLVGEFLEYNLARWADSVIAVTDTIKAAFEKNGIQSKNQIYVIPNGVEDSFIQRAQQAMRDFTKSEFEETTVTSRMAAPVFMFSGNTAAYQGIDLMLKAFALVLQRIPGAQLRILTHESFIEYQPLVKSIGISDKLSIMDVDLEELPGMLVQADVLINPRTKCAGIPQKLLNYMASGRPVVSFEGSAKIVTNRVNGLVIKNGDIQGLADAMLELVINRELGRTLSENALNLILARHSWSSAAKQTLEVYWDTLAKYV
jgi:glycosyltransferase involved in cell wall biosynthesis